MSFFRRPAALFVLALLFFAAGTWSLPLIDRDEPRFAEAAREMRQGGDYVVPYFNHQFRFDKPPLTYWLQVPAYRVLGETDFAARLPSVIAGALTVLVTYGFAARLFGGGTAWAAALIFMTSLQTFMHAKGAVADMLLVLFFTLATWAGWELVCGERLRSARARWGWWLVLYLAFALGFLAKGPIAWLPLGAIACYVLARRPGTTRLAPLPGLVLTVGLVALWGVPALLQTNGAYWQIGIGKHVVGRSLNAMEGHGSAGFLSYAALLPFYFVTVFASFFPWSLRLPWLVRRLGRSEGSARTSWRARVAAISNEQFYLLAGIAIVFAVFTLVRTKLPHYTLPAFPLLAILLAREVEVAGESARLDVSRWAGRTIVGCGVVALAVFPLIAGFFPGYALIQQSRAALKPEMEFAAAGYQEPSLVWYARRWVRGYFFPVRAEALAAFMARPGPRFCVAPAGVVKPEPGWSVFRTGGFNLVHWKKTTLELVVKPN